MGALIKGFLAKNKRQKLTILAVGFIVYVLALSGIFSYFHGSDAVTNTLRSVSQSQNEEGSVTIIEPQWDAVGETMAEHMEPGMQIPKDPSGKNDGDQDLYIRLKMTISFDAYVGKLTKNKTDLTPQEIQNGEIGIPSDDERMQRIIEQIIFDPSTSPATQFMTYNGTNWTCHNPSYSLEPGTNTEKPYVFYFYYIDSNSGNMKSVSPGGTTEPLFQRVDIPIYKKDYLGVFDQTFNITLEAEGIPVGSETTLTVEAAKIHFAS